MDGLESNPFFDPEILKILKQTKPNSEEDNSKYTSDLMDVIDLVIVDNAEEFENWLTQSFPLPKKYKPVFVHLIDETEELKGYLNPKISLIFAS
jgi:Histone acetyl transferase HAT1 N-terminus